MFPAGPLASVQHNGGWSCTNGGPTSDPNDPAHPMPGESRCTSIVDFSNATESTRIQTKGNAGADGETPLVAVCCLLSALCCLLSDVCAAVRTWVGCAQKGANEQAGPTTNAIACIDTWYAYFAQNEQLPFPALFMHWSRACLGKSSLFRRFLPFFLACNTPVNGYCNDKREKSEEVRLFCAAGLARRSGT